MLKLSEIVPRGTQGLSGAGLTIAGVLLEYQQELTSSHTITGNRNALSAGPISVLESLSVTVPSGSSWTII